MWMEDTPTPILSFTIEELETALLENDTFSFVEDGACSALIKVTIGSQARAAILADKNGVWSRILGGGDVTAALRAGGKD